MSPVSLMCAVRWFKPTFYITITIHLSLFEAAMVDGAGGDHTRVEIQNAWEQMKQDLRSDRV